MMNKLGGKEDNLAYGIRDHGNYSVGSTEHQIKKFKLTLVSFLESYLLFIGIHRILSFHVSNL